jgi:O-antigen/teichoic acid export membrane protein
MQILSKISTQLSITLVDQAIISGVNFLVSILLIRFLGMMEFGIFTLLWMSVQFIQSMQMAIISTPMMSIGPKQLSDDINFYYQAVISHQIAFSVISSVILYIAIVLSNYVVPQWNIVDYAFSLALLSFLAQNQDFIRRLLFVEGRTRAALLNDSLCYIGRLLLLSIIFIISEPSLSSVLWVMSVTLSLSVLSGLLIIKKPSFDHKYNVDVFKRHWKMSNWLAGSALLMWLSGNYFFISVGVLMGPVAVGILRATGNIIGITNILFQGLENIIPQSASKYFIQSGIPGLISYLLKVCIFGGTVVLLLAIFLSVFSEQIINLLYGQEYSGYGYVLIWYSIISIFSYFVLTLTIGLRTLENTKPQFISYVVTVIFSVLAANVFVTKFELNGALAGMLINQVIMLIVAAFFFLRTCKHLNANAAD